MKKTFLSSVSTEQLKQNEFFAYLCLSENNHKKLAEAVENGMPITPFMLTLTDYFGYSKEQVKQLVMLSERLSDEVFLWIKKYLDFEELRSVAQKFEGNLPASCKAEDCVELGLFNELLKRKAYKTLAEKAPDFLEKVEQNSEINIALLEADFERFAPIVYKRTNKLGIFLNIHGGWKYLIDADGKNVKFVLSNTLFGEGFFPHRAIGEYCYQKGYGDELYEYHYYYKILLENQEFEIFRKNRNTNEDFLKKYPKEVEWEALWEYYKEPQVRGYLKKCASANKNEPACREFLWKHSNFFKRLLMLSQE